MAIGDDAIANGMQTVPDTGEEGRVRWGGREINRTRDYIAQKLGLIPVGKSGFRTATGIYSGTTVPDNSLGDDGDIYYQIV